MVSFCNTSHRDLLDANIKAFNDTETITIDGKKFIITKEVRERNLNYIYNFVKSLFPDRKVTISSGFRFIGLNNRVGGTQYSQHRYAEALDIQVEGLDYLEVYRIIEEAIRAQDLTLTFSQLIKETDGVSNWVHIAIVTERFIEYRYKIAKSRKTGRPRGFVGIECFSLIKD